MTRAAALALLVLSWACAPDVDGVWVDVPGRGGALKSAASERAARRAYDGAPPVIPHASFGADCAACHTREGLSVPGVGFAPASPHALTPGIGDTARCRQCHVERTTAQLFVPNRFEGLPQDLRRGARAHPLAPPVIPHQLLLRDNCAACHAGPAAREEIRTSHPERERCAQCHVPQADAGAFSRG